MNEQNYIERYWRDAKPEDAIKEPPIVARFRDSIDCNSAISIWSKPMHLVGWDRTDNMNWCNGQCWWKFCQVYDAPDPGEGWRLIDTENEQPQDGDEIYDASVGLWTRRIVPFTSNALSINRRRITPTVTYVPFTWEDRDQLRGRWIGSNDGRCQRLINMIHNDSDILCICGHPAEYFLNWTFLDTGEPVGKKVTE